MMHTFFSYSTAKNIFFSTFASMSNQQGSTLRSTQRDAAHLKKGQQALSPGRKLHREARGSFIGCIHSWVTLPVPLWPHNLITL